MNSPPGTSILQPAKPIRAKAIDIVQNRILMSVEFLLILSLIHLRCPPPEHIDKGRGDDDHTNGHFLPKDGHIQ